MRKALLLVGKAAVSGLLLYLALRSVDIGTVKDRFSQIDFRWIALILVLMVLQLVAVALRWQQIVIRCGAPLPAAQAFRFCMIASFFNQTLPSSVGGDAVRIWLLGKQTSWRAAAYSVFLDRVVGVVTLAILVVLCLPWTLELVRNPVGRAALLVVGPGFIGAGALFVALAWERLRILERWSATRHLAAMALVALKMARSPSSLAAILPLSFFIHLITVLTAWCAAHSVGANLPLLYSLYLVLPVNLMTVVPISIAGWGVREGAMVAAFSYAGLSTSDGLIVSLLYGATSLAIGAIGGIVWVLTTKRLNTDIVPAMDRSGKAS